MVVAYVVAGSSPVTRFRYFNRTGAAPIFRDSPSCVTDSRDICKDRKIKNNSGKEEMLRLIIHGTSKVPKS